MLTRRQREVFDFIRARISSTGRSPTYAEMGVVFGCEPSSIHWLVSQLVARGALHRLPRYSNGLSVARRYFAPTAEGRPWVVQLQSDNGQVIC